jgi:hypothetical protein
MTPSLICVANNALKLGASDVRAGAADSIGGSFIGTLDAGRLVHNAML